MSANKAYEHDNSDDRPTATTNGQRNTQNGRRPDENTSLNMNLDTYFADERIPIPERVSFAQNNALVHSFFSTCVVQRLDQ